MTKLYIDLETRSPINLKLSGSYAYAADARTEIICAAWGLDNEPLAVWFPLLGEDIPEKLRDALLDPSVMLCAHNISFDRVMMLMTMLRKQKCLTKEIVMTIRPLTRWDCTANRAAAMGLPRDLERAAKVLGISAQKDMEGHKLMMKMCKPRMVRPDGSLVWWESPEDMKRLGEYCARDVEPQRQIDLALPDLSDFERKVWLTTERMNDRGCAVDSELLIQMSMFVSDAEADLNKRLREATNGAVPKVSNHLAVRRWVIDQGFPDVEETGIGKQIVTEMLENENLPDIVREVLLMRQDGGKTSTSKYRALLNRSNIDGRIRGSFMYCGASATKRWSSKGVQLQNLGKNPTLKDPKVLISALMDIRNGASIHEIADKYASPIIVASELVRPTFIAKPGHWLVRGDYSQIEDRINCWYGGETSELAAFSAYDRGEGPDPYRVRAGAIYHVDPLSIPKSDPRRQVGKVSRLATGFEGGVGAIMRMAKIYNVPMDEASAQEIKLLSRAAIPGIQSWWKQLDESAIRCVRSPTGTRINLRRGASFVRGSSALILRGPNGSSLIYWYPKVEKVMTSYGKERFAVTFWAEDLLTHQWTKSSMYGGKWCENLTQFTSRCITADSLIKLDALGYAPVITVHDENVCEMSKERFPTIEEASAAVMAVMRDDPPEWTAGIPVNVDCTAGERYLKD